HSYLHLISPSTSLNATPTTEIYTLSLHDALPISDDPTTTSDTTSEPTATTQETSAPTTSPDTSSTETTSAETTPTDTGSTDSPSDPLPTNAADYATVAFDAWTAGDRDLLARLFTEQALQALDELSVDPAGDWEFVRCEGAAGSSYCSWMGPDG